MVTVLVAHEQRLVRQAIIKILSAQKRISVIGDAASGRDAAIKAEQLMPDVIVANSVLPGLNGLVGPKEDDGAKPQVVVMPRRENGNGAGGASRLTYDNDIVDLIEAVISAGGSKAEDGESNLSLAALDRLTRRERQILTLIADGKSNKQIAAQMTITQRTVKYHISNILRKLGLFSRTEAAVLFLKGSYNDALGS